MHSIYPPPFFLKKNSELIFIFVFTTTQYIACIVKGCSWRPDVVLRYYADHHREEALQPGACRLESIFGFAIPMVW